MSKRGNPNKAKNKKLIITLITAGVIIAAAMIAGIMFQNPIKTYVYDTKVDIENHGNPSLVFDDTKSPGWWSSGNTWARTGLQDTQVDTSEWPIASLSAHQCAEASKCSNPEKDTMGAKCFVLAFYQDEVIDPKEAVAKKLAENEKYREFTKTKELGSKTSTINTPEGEKEYQLYKFEYTQTSGEAGYKGNGFGFIPQSKGHVEVRSICLEADQLDQTIPALKAISLKAPRSN